MPILIAEWFFYTGNRHSVLHSIADNSADGSADGSADVSADVSADGSAYAVASKNCYHDETSKKI